MGNACNKVRLAPSARQRIAPFSRPDEMDGKETVMASGKRILGLILILVGVCFAVFGVAALISSLDKPLTFTVLGLVPYIALIIGGGLLFSGAKLVRSAGQVAARAADRTPAGAAGTTASTFASVAVMLVVGWYYFGGGLETQTTRSLQEIKDKVAADAVAQYGIAKRNGTAIDACVQAGMVGAAYLQAQNEPQYQRWKQTEKADCAKAGIDR
jgi:hypothetical protein